ncbi:hypothetical protein [Rhizobium sp. L1K21]|uniref:hypothetical protein n=1 Tax=Rhizobium sp. L1K21 TaxID=2954933 RepID=UPI002092B29A|nr:hypothetical protein [Rhizobium sp. L1K21]MCO6187100.1 hypothetical protein [Rhizobium sp. L1K21]
MKSRSDKLRRLVAVQRHMERMAEIELASTAQARQELVEKQENAMQAISSMEPIHAGLKNQYALQYERHVSRDAQLEKIQEVQEKQVLREKAKGDRLNDHFLLAREGEDREREEEGLLDLLEIRLASPASSKLDET